MNIVSHNRKAWDKLVENGNRWTIPVSHEEISSASKGEWKIYLTETKPVPHEWLPDMKGAQVLCFASGGDQQGPILAAAGADVTVFDNSPKQLKKDHVLAETEGLPLQTVQGDMRELSAFGDCSFDLIVHPVSNIFIDDVRPVWAEAFRVLRVDGELLVGFVNPADYLFDPELLEKGELRVKYSLPYSDADSITEEERIKLFGDDAPIEYCHTLEEQIRGQLNAGLVLIGFYEDHRSDSPIANYMPSYFATLARKPMHEQGR
jgi:SAM-dependent methyltransferase